VVGTRVQETYDLHPSIRDACASSISGHAHTPDADLEEAMAERGVTGDFTAESLAAHTQAVLQGAFVLAKAQDDVSLLPESFVEGVSRQSAEGPALTVQFTLAGAPFMILNGGPHYALTPAASISVVSEDQEETDRLWGALLEGGGQESRCGWLTDRFGVSWQIVPEALPTLIGAADSAAASRAREAMFQMRKLNIAALEAAFRGEAVGPTP